MPPWPRARGRRRERMPYDGRRKFVAGWMRGLLAAFDGGGSDMTGGETLMRVECGGCWRLLTGADRI